MLKDSCSNIDSYQLVVTRLSILRGKNLNAYIYTYTHKQEFYITSYCSLDGSFYIGQVSGMRTRTVYRYFCNIRFCFFVCFSFLMSKVIKIGPLVIWE